MMGREGLHDDAFSCSMVSFVGRGFFSCVSVFFSLDLSKLVTSEMSGLSLIVAISLGGGQKWGGQFLAGAKKTIVTHFFFKIQPSMRSAVALYQEERGEGRKEGRCLHTKSQPTNITFSALLLMFAETDRLLLFACGSVEPDWLSRHLCSGMLHPGVARKGG